MTVLAGGRTEREAAPLATLSGKQDLSTRLFVSASNFMVVKFSSDASVERKGFRASWKTEPQSCLGNLKATGQTQELTSPGYPANYPGGLECLYIITAQPGKIITLDVSIFSYLFLTNHLKINKPKKMCAQFLIYVFYSFNLDRRFGFGKGT